MNNLFVFFLKKKKKSRVVGNTPRVCIESVVDLQVQFIDLHMRYRPCCVQLWTKCLSRRSFFLQFQSKTCTNCKTVTFCLKKIKKINKQYNFPFFPHFQKEQFLWHDAHWAWTPGDPLVTLLESPLGDFPFSCWFSLGGFCTLTEIKENVLYGEGGCQLECDSKRVQREMFGCRI